MLNYLPKEKSPMNKRKILIVDDEVKFAKNIEELLRRKGWNSLAVFGGRKAIEVVRHSAFDVILLDMRMPEMDGFETLREILRIREDACVLFLTAFGDIKSAVRALREGAVDLLLKGLAIDELIAIIEKAIEHRDNQIIAREVEIYEQAFETTRVLAMGMSHQIGNRLNGIGYQLELLESDRTEEDRRRHLEDAREIVDLGKLAVNRLYAFGKLRTIELGPVDLRSVVTAAIDMANVRHSDSGQRKEIRVNIEVSPEIAVKGNEGFLAEAIECLVDNAMDHVSSGGTVSIGASGDGERVTLTVADDGPGFDPKMLGKAHLPFKTKREQTHVGFGLTFAKQVAETCGGSFEYGNREGGRGARVTMTLAAAIEE